MLSNGIILLLSAVNYYQLISRIPGTRSELFHDGLPLFLRHISMHTGHSEVSFSHLFCQPVDLSNIATVHIYLCRIHQHCVTRGQYLGMPSVFIDSALPMQCNESHMLQDTTSHSHGTSRESQRRTLQHFLCRGYYIEKVHSKQRNSSSAEILVR